MFPHNQGYASPCTHLAQYSEAPRAHGYFIEVVNLASAEAMVGAFRIRRSTPIAITDHRLPPHLQHAYYKTLLLQTAAD